MFFKTSNGRNSIRVLNTMPISDFVSLNAYTNSISDIWFWNNPTWYFW